MRRIRPKNITVNNDSSELKIIRKNFHPQAIFLLLFCIFWNSFLVIWYTITINSSIMFKVFPIFHVAIGLYLTYHTLTMFINKIEIIMNSNIIKITDNPLPIGNTKILELDKIKRFYPYEKYSYINRKRIYEIHAKITDGDDIKIIKGLYNTQECKYIATKLNNKKRNVI